MHKSERNYTCAGCDTSKETINVVRCTPKEQTSHRCFANTHAWHGHLIT